MKIKTFIALVFSIVLLSFTNVNAKSLIFYVVPKMMQNPFYEPAAAGCAKAAEELDGISCVFIGPAQHNEEEQLQIVSDLLAKGVDGISMAPSNAPAMGKLLRKENTNNVPIITFDSDLQAEDRDLRLAYVGTHNYAIGVNLAKITMELKPGGGTVCLLSGGAAANNLNERMQGFRDTVVGSASSAPPGPRLDGQNGWSEVDGCPVYSNDDVALSVQQMADVMNKYSDLGAFVPVGGWPQFAEAAYKDAVAAHMDRVSSKKTLLVVADTLPQQLEALKAGLSHAQVGQKPYQMGYDSVYILKEVIEGNLRAVDDASNNAIYTGLDICLPDNVDTCTGG